jgi:hypothetical protein
MCKKKCLPFHHNVIEDSAEDTTDDLSGEGTLWRELCLLSEL